MRVSTGVRRGSWRLVVVVCAVALVASACAWVPRAHPGKPGDPLQIVAPVAYSQAPADGTVPIELAFSRRVSPGLLRAWLLTAVPHGPVRDVSDRLEVDGRVARGTLEAADLQPGLSKLVVMAIVRLGWLRIPVFASTVFSWEPDIDVSAGPGCDFLSTRACLLPFPSDAYTVADPTSDTGRRVAFGPESSPADANGDHVDPAEWNRNDGFSPGTTILAHVPGIDLTQTGAAPITDLERSLDADSPIVVIDADTGERHLQWAELDANATSDAERALIIRPGANFEEGHRYIVALRRLVDGAGNRIAAPRAFQVYRDGVTTFVPEVEQRREHMEQLFATLHDAGIGRHNLYLAWDFTVASERSLAGRMLHIRDDAFAALGDAAPSFDVTAVEDNVDDRIFRRVHGTFEVPLYLTGSGEPGTRFNYDTAAPDAVPARNGTFSADFQCNIPRVSSVDGADPVQPARGVVYGHGLLGHRDEINAGNVRDMANEHNMVMCATDWIGMSEGDIGNVVSIINDFSRFPTLSDRVQQGILNALFLARLIRDPEGFATDSAFRFGASDTPVLRANEVYYDGNSQGGIIGGAATAVSTEWTRAVLGVPGMNYSTLLRRSVDFDPFQALLEPVYPDKLDQTIGIALIQMLWDRAEANGYAHHMTDDPYPGTPAHTVMLHEAFGDHQVANVTTEIEARTIGAFLRAPALAPGRHSDVDPFFGIPVVPSLPFGGSVLVVWDSGNPAPPIANVPPRPPAFGDDPHGRPRAQVSARLQKSEFLKPGGAFVDVCGGSPCLAP